MKKIIATIALLTATYFVNAQTVSAKDQKFINDAVQGGLMEVKLGELAQANGSTKEIKDLGQHMMDDHSKANEELASLAAKKNATVPTTMSKEGEDAYNMLSKKSGSDFDKAYTECMVKDHKKVISEFKKESTNGDDSEVKAWASKTIPTLEHHERMSESACKMAKAEK